MSDDVAFLDANVLIYHLVQPDHEHSAPSTALLGRIRGGEERAYLPSTVIAECAFVCTRVYEAGNKPIAVALLEILSYPGISTDHPEALAAGLDLWRSQGPLSFADCFHLALAKQLGMTRIYSFDRKMDRYPGVERVEPAKPIG
jgi:predicted nucleic acid-binding protein